MKAHHLDQAWIVIATPYLADANNGNWRTAHRWSTLLSQHYRVIVQGDESEKIEASQSPTAAPDLLIALHARRSASLIQQCHTQHPDTPIVVVLTGTDLYKDLPYNADAQASLQTANALIVLQEDAIQHIPLQYRHKTHVVFQSAKPLAPAQKTKGKLQCVVVGHLRDEKDPTTILNALNDLPTALPIHITHIGAPLDTILAAASQAKMAEDGRYHWVGALSHGLTRAAIKRSHVLIHPSMMEGGANVIAEAILSGTPVLASKMSGNIGMLGYDYSGYFPVGDAKTLAALMQKCLSDPNFLLRLNIQAQGRAQLFLPATERDTLKKIIQSLIGR